MRPRRGSGVKRRRNCGQRSFFTSTQRELRDATGICRRSAIFASPGQKPQLVAQGGEIGPCRLTAIAPDRVDLLGPQGPVTLHPQFVTAVPAAVAN